MGKQEKKSKTVYMNEQTSLDKLSLDERLYGYERNKEPDHRKRDSNLFANSYMDDYKYDEWN